MTGFILFFLVWISLDKVGADMVDDHQYDI